MTAHADQPVRVLSDVIHDFDDRGLYYRCRHAAGIGRQIYIDPAPCYPHDHARALEEFERLRVIAPLPFPLALFLLSHETTGRTNGTFYDDYAYALDEIEMGGKKICPPLGFIVLSAKRIPIHPAMTRYLVSHEYGHAVAYHLARRAGISIEKFKQQYIDECRPDAGLTYGCGKWHAHVGELIANDFRILVAERESEFWPHPGFARPESVLAVIGFWARAARELRA